MLLMLLVLDSRHALIVLVPIDVGQQIKYLIVVDFNN